MTKEKECQYRSDCSDYETLNIPFLISIHIKIINQLLKNMPW